MNPIQRIPQMSGVPNALVQTLNNRFRAVQQNSPAPAAANAAAVPAQNSSGIIAAVTLTAQAAAILATDLLGSSIPAVGVYRLTGYFVVSTAGTGSAVITITWNDGVHAQSFGAFGGALTSLGAYVQYTLIIRADGVHNVQYAASYTGGGGAAYNFYLRVEQLG